MLISKNIYINKKRTSMKLDPENWDALAEICKEEKISLNALLTLINELKGDVGLSIATRVFIVSYLKNMIKNIKLHKSPTIDNIKDLNKFLSLIYKKRKN